MFVEPALVAEVEYRAWTDDGKQRHASFKGIRERPCFAKTVRGQRNDKQTLNRPEVQPKSA